MFSGRSDSFSPTTPPTLSSVLMWTVLAFQAGALNTGGFLACHRFVSHVTGFSTMFGTEVAYGNYKNAFGFLSVPVFFLVGSMLSALFIDRRLLKHQTPHYHFSFGLLTVITGAVLAMGVMGEFGAFGAALEMGRDYSLLALLCLASGIQNATVTSTYGAVVRTTHLTGLTTDLGIGLVRLASADWSSGRVQQEVHATSMRVSIIASFTLGSVVSAIAYLQTQYWGFVIPFVVSVGLWILSLAFLFKRGYSQIRE
ncbi:MAG: YoaK family protein [Bdellovibrionales bacterium]